MMLKSLFSLGNWIFTIFLSLKFSFSIAVKVVLKLGLDDQSSRGSLTRSKGMRETVKNTEKVSFKERPENI